VICFIAWRADLLGAEGKRSYANNVHMRIMPVGWSARRLADMSSRIYGHQADPVIAPRFGSPRVVYDAHVLAVAVVVLKPGLLALVRRFWLLAVLFIIFHHPQQFQSRQNRRLFKVSLASPGGFDLRAWLCVHVYVL
jgi:hypothetical protein